MSDDTEEKKDDTEKKKSGPPMKEVVLKTVQDKFDGGRDDGERCYLVQKAGPNVAIGLGPAKKAVAGVMYEVTGIIPGRTPLDEAFTVIEYDLGKVPKKELPLRVGTADDGSSVIDMGDEKGRAITLSAGGWKVVPRSPITFKRTRATMAMVEPIAGGNVDRIFEIVNVSEDQRRLVLAHLVSTLIEDVAHPIVIMRGEQGSAKSTTARVLATMIDPTAAPLVSPPRDADKWLSSCSAHWVVSIDNVSKVPDWWSDSLCRVVTKGGEEKRALYTDDDVHVTSHRRCVILNGIALSGLRRADLLERAIAFDMERPEDRLTDKEVTARLAEILPEALGGLLDLAVKVLGTEVERPDLPRMADFGLILAKVDAVLGDGPSALDAYRDQLEELFEESKEGDVVASTVISLMSNRSEWAGSTAELLSELTSRRFQVQNGRPGSYWPDHATELGHALLRSAPLLRSEGIEIESTKVGSASKRKRGKRITKKVDGLDGVDGLSLTLRFREEEREEESHGEKAQVQGQTVHPVHTVQHGHPIEGAIECPRCARVTKTDLVTGLRRCISMECGHEVPA